MTRNVLEYKGHHCLRQRLVMSCLSGTPIRIRDIRADMHPLGINEKEASFIRLIEKVTNGSVIEINHTGTVLYFIPGIVVGGRVVHDCGPCAIGSFLLPILCLAPFAKTPFLLDLSGITNDNIDVSVDLIRTVFLPSLVRFGVSDDISLEILIRGAPPLGGGLVRFSCPILQSLVPVSLLDAGLIHRIRGIAYCTRISPLIANRMVDACRPILSRFIPDVYLYTDIYKGAESGASSGYALSLVAESTTETLISTEVAYQPRKNSQLDTLYEKDSGDAAMLVEDYTFDTPEELGIRAAHQLLAEIAKGGSVDSYSQWIHLLFIALGPEDVGKVRFGSLTPFTISFLRDLKQFFNVTFKIVPDVASKTIVLTSVGIGFTNVNKKVN